MVYSFNNKMEFANFVEESLNRGDYTQDLENFKKGINTFRIDDPATKTNWDWLKLGKLYLVNNSVIPSRPSHFIIYRLSLDKLWYYSVTMHYPPLPYIAHVFKIPVWDGIGSSMDMWVSNYLELNSHAISFMNWINENPFEVK